MLPSVANPTMKLLVALAYLAFVLHLATASSTENVVEPKRSADDPNPATVHLLCGMIASGKSTFGRALAHRVSGVLFSADEWMLTLFGEEFPVERFHEHGDRVKEMIWSVASDLVVRHKIDVVLDFSLWQRDEREKFRARAEQIGGRVQLYHVYSPDALIRARLVKRNAALPAGTFFVSLETYQGWRDFFETPGADERAVRVDTSVDPDWEPHRAGLDVSLAEIAARRVELALRASALLQVRSGHDEL